MGETWFDEDEHVAEVVSPAKSEMLTKMRDSELAELEDEAALARARLKGVENKIFERALEVVEGALGFVELDPKDPLAIPQKWIDDLGEDRAAQKHFAARAALANGKEAPAGLKIAENMAAAVIRARAAEKQAQVNIGIEKVLIMEAPQAPFPEMVVEAPGEEEDEEY